MADAANILYTIGRFPRGFEERRAWIETMRAMQDSESGLFEEATHHPFHTTAHLVAALELFDAGPRYPLTGMHPYLERGALRAFLDGLDWVTRPWPQSHRGAGLYAALTIAGEADRDWEDAYFDWLWAEADPATGFWRRGCVPADGSAERFPHLAGTFHYLFNHEAARKPLRYPAAMIDTALAIYEEGQGPSLGRRVGFAEVDWVYCLTRPLKQCGHRFGEVRRALRAFARDYADYVLAFEEDAAELDDLHNLFGCLCCFAELQQALPGLIETPRPLKLVLDRRPFI